MKKHPSPSAFTLIEIIVCMAIFAVGFAAIAMMLPAGTVMQRDIEARGIGDIVGRNALEVVKGKGIQALTLDYRGTNVFPTNLDRNVWDYLTPSSAVNKDMDWLVFQGGNAGNWSISGATASAALGPYFDADHDLAYFRSNGNGCYYNADQGDETNFLMGRIHAFKERPVPGCTLGGFSMLDFSYPSSLLNVSARTYFASVLRTNQTVTGNPDCTHPYEFASPGTYAWTLTAVTNRRADGAEWPEQVEWDPANPAGMWFGSGLSLTPSPIYFLASNTPADFRSAWGDSSLVGTESNPGPPRLDPYNASFDLMLWPSTAPYGSMGVVPPTGGDPNNGTPWFRGWCDISSMTYWGAWVSVYGSVPGRQGWNYPFWPMATTPIPEQVASQYNFPNAPNAYRYPLPCLFEVPAIVYNRDKDLLLIRYPQCFAQKLVDTGKGELTNARAKAYRAACKIDSALNANDGAGWMDRKLKVGDKFLIGRGVSPVTVKELLDPVAAAATAPGGPVNWSDGTYQIVRVTPSLSSFNLTANKPVDDKHIWTQPCPSFVLVAPPPVSGGPSPWVSTQQLNDGGSSGQNGAAFRRWDNLTD